MTPDQVAVVREPGPQRPAAGHPVVAADVAAVEIVIGPARAAFRRAVDGDVPWHRAHLTALAWTVDVSTERLLLVRHRLHGWSCPGGHVDPGEHPRAAAARELAEETGLTTAATIAAGIPYTLSTSIGCARQPGARHLAIGYLFTVDAATPLRSEPGQPAAWFDRRRLPRPRSGDIDVVVTHLAAAHKTGQRASGRPGTDGGPARDRG